MGHLDDERLDPITATVGELVDDLSSHKDAEAIAAPSDTNSALGALVAAEQKGETPIAVSDVWKAPRSILCIPEFGKLDKSAAIVVAQEVGRRGYGAAAEPADALSVSKFFSLDLSGAELVCLCYVDRPSHAKIQYAVRRLTKKAKAADVMILLLGGAAEASVGEETMGVSAVTNSFATALQVIEQKAIGAATTSKAIAVVGSAQSASR